MALASPRFVRCGGSAPTPGSSTYLTNQPLLGVINGINTTFTTGSKFVHDALRPEQVYLRGKRLREGAGNDYLAAESGGAGTGYDTIVLAQAPLTPDNLLIDYHLAP